MAGSMLPAWLRLTFANSSQTGPAPAPGIWPTLLAGKPCSCVLQSSARLATSLSNCCCCWPNSCCITGSTSSCCSPDSSDSVSSHCAGLEVLKLCRHASKVSASAHRCRMGVTATAVLYAEGPCTCPATAHRRPRPCRVVWWSCCCSCCSSCAKVTPTGAAASAAAAVCAGAPARAGEEERDVKLSVTLCSEEQGCCCCCCCSFFTLAEPLGPMLPAAPAAVGKKTVSAAGMALRLLQGSCVASAAVTDSSTRPGLCWVGLLPVAASILLLGDASILPA